MNHTRSEAFVNLIKSVAPQPTDIVAHCLTTIFLLEADLVAHCGADREGGYLYMLTDVATGRIECLPLLHRSQEAVLAALQRARTIYPFPISLALLFVG